MDNVLPAPIDVARYTPPATAAFGYLAFGSVSALAGFPPWATLVASVVPLVATLPTLIVVHQWIGLSATPGAVARAVLDAWQRAGLLALSFAPILLFFAAADIAPVVVWLLAVGLATAALTRGALSLAELEKLRAGSEFVIGGWFLLTAAIGHYTWLRVLP